MQSITQVQQQNMDQYTCAITCQIMADPVVAADGHTYEREAIEEWLQVHNTSPKTNLSLTNKTLTETLDKRAQILEFLEQNPGLLQHKYLPKSLIEKLIAAIKGSQIEEMERCFAKDVRLLSILLDNNYTAWHLACEYGSASLLKVLLGQLASKCLVRTISCKPLPLRFKPIYANQLLVQVLEQEQLEIASNLVALGAEIVQITQATQESLLHKFVNQGKLAVVKWLLQNRDNVEQVNIEGNTPLLLAVLRGQQPIVKLLLEHQANREHKNNNKHDPIILAALNNDAAMLKLLTGSDAPALHLAVQTNDSFLVSELLRSSHTKLTMLEVLDSKQCTPLYVAISNNNLLATNLLLSAGANPNASDTKGRTVLHIAVKNDKPKLVAALLAHDVDVDAFDLHGNTPLHLAAKLASNQVIPLLLQADANYKARNYLGTTPMKMALLTRNLVTLKLIEKTIRELKLARIRGVNKLALHPQQDNNKNLNFFQELGAQPPAIRATEDMSYAPGCHVVHNRLEDGVFGLIDNKDLASLEAKLNNQALLWDDELKSSLAAELASLDRQGRTVVGAAISSGSIEILNAILKADVSLELPDAQGQTPLHLAIELGQLKLIKELLCYNLPLSARNKAGQTPIELAITKLPAAKYQEIAALLGAREGLSKFSDNQLNLNKILAAILEIFPRVEPARGKDKLLFLGATGAGKSTLLNYLCGAKYVIERTKAGKTYAVCTSNNEQAKTSSGMASETLYPQILENSDLDFVYCDLAGLFDSRGKEERICAANGLKVLSMPPGKIKGIVVALDTSGFLDARGGSFKEVAVILHDLLKGDPSLMSCVYFVITKPSPTLDVETAIKEFIQPMLADGNENSLACKVQRQQADAKEKALHFMLVNILRNKDRILIGRIEDINAKQQLEETFARLVPKEAGCFNFSNYEASQKEFNQVLIGIAKWYLEQISIIAGINGRLTVSTQQINASQASLAAVKDAGQLDKDLDNYLDCLKEKTDLKNHLLQLALELQVNTDLLAIAYNLVTRLGLTQGNQMLGEFENQYTSGASATAPLLELARKTEDPVICISNRQIANIALEKALISQQFEKANLLLKFGADVEQASNNNTLLHRLISQPLEVIQWLLLHGANPAAKNNQQFDAVALAALNNEIRILRLLLDKSEIPPIVHLAVHRGDSALLKELLKNPHSHLEVVDKGCTPLYLAIEHSNKSCIQVLIENKANPNVVCGRKQRTPLHLAAYRNNRETVEQLLSLGARINAADLDGNTALHLAAKLGHDAIVLLLLRAQANYKNKNHQQETPAELAFKTNQRAIVKLIADFVRSMKITKWQDLEAQIAAEARDRKTENSVLNEVISKENKVLRELIANETTIIKNDTSTIKNDTSTIKNTTTAINNTAGAINANTNSIKTTADTIKNTTTAINNTAGAINANTDTIKTKLEEEILISEQKRKAAKQQLVDAAKEREAVHKFLQCVVEGEQDQAEAMLKKTPKLALYRGNVTDLSGRTFNNITGFQYAVWALDSHMWKMFLRDDYLPTDEAREQVQGLETGSWVVRHGVSASWQNLIDALDEFIKLCDEVKYDQATKQWNGAVGNAQQQLPVHVVNQYCHPTRSFSPCPNFQEESALPRSRKTGYGDWFTCEYNGGKLGKNCFAFYRCSDLTCLYIGCLMPPRWSEDIKNDRIACVTYLNHKTQLREQLLSDLARPSYCNKPRL